MKFEAHGNLDFSIQKQCVINRPSMAFNKEGIEQLYHAVLTQVEAAGLEQWCLLELLTADAFVTPDALQSIEQIYPKYIESGCTGIHVVCSNLQSEVFHQIAKTTGIDFYFYDTEADAFAANKVLL